jgi:hypothetical protein
MGLDASGSGEIAQSSYWCARSGGSEIVGSYDGLESWTIFAANLTAREEQVMVSLHERLHHELQHSSPWGLVTRFAADLARLGVDRPRLSRLGAYCREQARYVHECYATTLSVGDDPTALSYLADNPVYTAFYKTGRGLLTDLDWEQGRFFVDAVLRAAMSPVAVSSAMRSGYGTVRIADLDAPTTRPDDRLAAVCALDLPAIPAEHLGPHSTPDELGVYFDEVSNLLDRHGIPTLKTAEVRRLVASLFDDIARLSPDLRDRIELDTRRDHIADDLEEHTRERIVLHDGGPLPLEIVPMNEIAGRVSDLARDHETLGTHVLMVWARSDILSRQFLAPNPLQGRQGFVIGFQAAGTDDAGHAVVRLGMLNTDSPAEVASIVPIPVVCLTTAASLVDAPGSARSDGIDTIYAVTDLPIVPQLTHTFSQGATVTWTHLNVEGGRRLHVFAYKISVLPGIVWLQFTGEAGRHYVTRWLR